MEIKLVSSQSLPRWRHCPPGNPKNERFRIQRMTHACLPWRAADDKGIHVQCSSRNVPVSVPLPVPVFPLTRCNLHKPKHEVLYRSSLTALPPVQPCHDAYSDQNNSHHAHIWCTLHHSVAAFSHPSVTSPMRMKSRRDGSLQRFQLVIRPAGIRSLHVGSRVRWGWNPLDGRGKRFKLRRIAMLWPWPGMVCRRSVNAFCWGGCSTEDRPLVRFLGPDLFHNLS